MEIIRIKLSLSNAYLIKDKKSVLVDAGAPKQADQILAAVRKVGVDERNISLILHTHGHFDHAGSTAELKRRLKIPVAVHVKDTFMLREGRNGEIKPRNFEARVIAALVPKSFEPSEPELIIKEEISLKDFGVDAQVIFTPGHTKGSVGVLGNNYEAIIGDLLMGGWLGGAFRSAYPNYHYYVDDLSDLHASLKKVLGHKPARLDVGHGGPLSYEDTVRRFATIS